MNEFLLSLITHGQALMWLFSIVCAFIAGLWQLFSVVKNYLDKLIKGLDTKISSLDTKVTSLDTKVTSLATKVTSLDTEVKGIKADVEGIKTKVEENSRQIAGLQVGFNTLQFALTNFSGMAIKSSSPLSLTEFGEKLSKYLNAEQLVQKYADKWLAQISIKLDAHRLEVEDACFTFCEQKLLESISTKEAETIKDAIFERRADRKNITHVFGIILRDHIFNQRGINIPKIAAGSSADKL